MDRDSARRTTRRAFVVAAAVALAGCSDGGGGTGRGGGTTDDGGDRQVVDVPTVSVDATADAAADTVTVTHQAGESLTMGDLTIEVRGPDARRVWRGRSSDRTFAVGDELALDVAAGTAAIEGDPVWTEPSDGTLSNLRSGTTYAVELVDRPTNSVVAERSVTP